MAGKKTLLVNPSTHCPICLEKLPKEGEPCANAECMFSPEPYPHYVDLWHTIEDARVLLYKRHQYICHMVTSLSRPVMTTQVPTAAVGPRKDGGVLFMFNPNFLRKLSHHKNAEGYPMDVAFVQAHESTHVLSGHLESFHNPAIKNHMLYNICIDIMVNTWLLEAGLECSPELRRTMWDSTSIGMDPHRLLSYVTAEDLYFSLENQVEKVQEMMAKAEKMLMSGDIKGPQENPGDAQDSGKEMTPGEGQQGDGDQPSQIDGHKDMKDIDRKTAQGLMKQVKDSGAIDRQRQAGKNVSSEMERQFEMCDQSFDWESQIRNFMASIIRKVPSWERPHRLGEVMTDNRFFKQGEVVENRYFIAVYVDVSGSISPDEIGRFRSVLLQHPPQVTLVVYTFDTKIHEWKNWERTRPPGGGGTAFDEIVRHAENSPTFDSKKMKFDGHVVLTDGGDAEPTVKQKRKWLWVTTQILHPGQHSGRWTKMPPHSLSTSR